MPPESETPPPPTDEEIAVIAEDSDSEGWETITLKKPIKRGSTTIASFRMREPDAGNLRGLDVQNLLTGDINALIVLVPRISDPALIANEVERLKPSDIAQVAGAVRGFFMTDEEMGALKKYLGVNEAEETSTG